MPTNNEVSLYEFSGPDPMSLGLGRILYAIAKKQVQLIKKIVLSVS